jgi:hypothetical protein
VEVSDAATADSVVPDSAPSRRIALLIIVHLIIATLPVTLGLVTFSQYSLPYIWAVSSVPFAQIMLLAIWIGIGQSKLLNKVVTALLGVAYISFWFGIGTSFLDSESLRLEDFVRNSMQILAILAVVSLVIFGLRRWLGRIYHYVDPKLLDASAQTRYSLFTALGLTTAGAFCMALFRISTDLDDIESSYATIAHIILIMTTLALMSVSIIWAALAPGPVRYRITAIAVLVVLLGASLAVSAGHTPEQGGWLMLAAATVIVVVPAMIVCGSLLFLRAGGYRLVKTPTPFRSPRNSLTAI